MMCFVAVVSCVGEKKNSENLSDTLAVENLSDAETEEIYGDSPSPEWIFEVVVKEDKARDGEKSYLHAGGFKYEGLTIKSAQGYAVYSNSDDFLSMITMLYLADHLSYLYSKSGDTYPSKKDWKEFQKEVLGPLCEGAWNWEAIPVKKWRKKAGDYFYKFDNRSVIEGPRGAEWQSYVYFEDDLSGTTWKRQLSIRALSANNEFKLPEGVVFICTDIVP